jgi:hypothetical protein
MGYITRRSIMDIKIYIHVYMEFIGQIAIISYYIYIIIAVMRAETRVLAKSDSANYEMKESCRIVLQMP